MFLYYNNFCQTAIVQSIRHDYTVSNYHKQHSNYIITISEGQEAPKLPIILSSYYAVCIFLRFAVSTSSAVNHRNR